MPGDHHVPEKYLTAIYDLEVAYASFDFVIFLVLSEIARRKSDCDGINVIVVPDCGDGFGANALYGDDQKEWRVRNIVMPSCGLLPSVRQLTVCSAREQARAALRAAKGPIFPEDYALENPVARIATGEVVWNSLLGFDTHVLKASPQARAYMKSWIDGRCGGREAVAITLRESSYHANQNQDFRSWAAFARDLKKAGYFPVVVRDIETCLLPPPPEFEGIDLFPAAAFNLDLRLALYEESFLHMTLANGAGTLGLFSKDVQFLHFVSGDQSHPDRFPHGYQGGGTPPFCNRFQKNVWRPQEPGILMEEFLKMADLIAERTRAGKFNECLEPDRSRHEPLKTAARRFLELHDWQLFRMASDYLVNEDPSDPEIHYLIGLAETRMLEASDHGDLDRAQAALERAISEIARLPKSAGRSPEIRKLEGQALNLLGDAQAAERCFRDMIESGYRDIEALVGFCDALTAQGRYPESLKSCEEALAGELAEKERLLVKLKMATVLNAMGLVCDAIDLLGELVDGAAPFVEPYELLGQIYESQDRLADAAEIYRAAVSAGVAGASIVYRLGLALKSLGDTDGSELCFKLLVDRGTKDAGVFAQLGDVLMSKDRLDDARACYATAIRRDAADREILERYSNLAQGSD